MIAMKFNPWLNCLPRVSLFERSSLQVGIQVGGEAKSVAKAINKE